MVHRYQGFSRECYLRLQGSLTLELELELFLSSFVTNRSFLFGSDCLNVPNKSPRQICRSVCTESGYSPFSFLHSQYHSTNDPYSYSISYILDTDRYVTHEIKKKEI